MCPRAWAWCVYIKRRGYKLNSCRSQRRYGSWSRGSYSFTDIVDGSVFFFMEVTQWDVSGGGDDGGSAAHVMSGFWHCRQKGQHTAGLSHKTCKCCMHSRAGHHLWWLCWPSLWLSLWPSLWPLATQRCAVTLESSTAFPRSLRKRCCRLPAFPPDPHIEHFCLYT